MFKKIVLCLVFAMMIIGAVSAANQTNFKAPSDFVDIGDGVYVLYDCKRFSSNVFSILTVASLKNSL